jgi:hypothetical protein
MWIEYIKVFQENNCQPQILIKVKISYYNWDLGIHIKQKLESLISQAK